MNAYLKLTGDDDSTGAIYYRAILALTHVVDGTIDNSNAQVCGIHAQLGGGVIAAAGNVNCIWADAGMAVVPTAGNYSIMRMSNNGAAVLDSIIDVYPAKTNYLLSFLNATVATTGANHIIESMTGDHAFDSNDYAIKVNLGGTTYYIPLIDALS